MHHRAPLFEALQSYEKDSTISFDVPGHKRGIGNDILTSYYGETVIRHDVNSMPRLDNIAHPTGVINYAQQLLADAYGADNGYFLVNGTTSGIQAMILSTCKPKDKLIVPRNIHKSVISALILSDVTPIYLYPTFDNQIGITHNITLESVQNTIEQHPDAVGIFIINPTYYGATCDIKTITEYAHQKGLVVLVDEAHGGHFPFSDKLPISAMEAGADMSAVSLHKTCGSFTQSSALLTRNTIDNHHVQHVLNMLTTTSASYLLMGSLDVARKNLVLNGNDMFSYLLPLIRETQQKINNITGFSILEKQQDTMFDYDETKLTIIIDNKFGYSGFDLYHLLINEYNIQMELAEPNIIMAIVTFADNEYTLSILVSALEHISKHYFKEISYTPTTYLSTPCHQEQILSMREAFYKEKESISLEKSVGRICGEAFMIYPPGIPLLMPGEVITEEIVAYFHYLQEQHTTVIGTNSNKVIVVQQ